MEVLTEVLFTELAKQRDWCIDCPPMSSGTHLGPAVCRTVRAARKLDDKVWLRKTLLSSMNFEEV